MSKEGDEAGSHVPVLLDAAIDGLRIRPDGIYIDGTFGRGGHSRAILAKLGAAGRLLALDRDPDAIAAADPALLADSRFELERYEIAGLKTIAAEKGIAGRVDGLLLDLGVSSPQLDTPERGFSFQSDAPLDMRMDPGTGYSAAEWLAAVSERELTTVLREYGEERDARRIAAAIVRARAERPIRRTGELADVVASVKPARPGRKHPATQAFQAIRIAVNDELGQLDAALEASLEVLAAGGRLCVISFHSLEDRRVKRFMREHAREAAPYRGLPEVPAEHRARLRPVGRMVRPGPGEIAANPRARSARLRVAERIRWT